MLICGGKTGPVPSVKWFTERG